MWMGCLILGSSLFTIMQAELLAQRERQKDLKATVLYPLKYFPLWNWGSIAQGAAVFEASAPPLGHPDMERHGIQ